MATFTYNARTRAGQKVEGTIVANDRRAALGQIEALGQIPVMVREQTSVVPAAKGKRGKLTVRRGATRMSGRDVLVFTTELSDLLASGMTLGNALNTLGNRKSGRPSDSIVQGLRDEIVRGTSLSDALARHPACHNGG